MRRNMTAVLFGVGGAVLVLIVWHLYVDHAVFHMALEAGRRGPTAVQAAPATPASPAPVK